MTIISAAQLFKKMQNLILLLLGDQTLYFITGGKGWIKSEKKTITLCNAHVPLKFMNILYINTFVELT